ncbi:MAG: hypothetical protein DRJ52_04810 [Thermoprotei archaeon]|nr:MAG: hypothetical protein DRJ52_04810 [Thermoprotei archaeon]
MPERIVCSKCNFVLYKGNDPVPPEEIIKKYGGRCPRCLSRLSITPRAMEISILKRKLRYLI